MHAARREAKVSVGVMIDAYLLDDAFDQAYDDGPWKDRVRKAMQELRDRLRGIPRRRRPKAPPAGSVPLPLK